MSYLGSYSDPTTVVTESMTYTIKNLKDFFGNTKSDEFAKYEDKFNRVMDEFLTYYTLDDKQIDAIHDAIQERIKSNHIFQPLDVPKFDDTMRLMDRNWALTGGDALLRYKEQLAKDGKTSQDDLLLFYLVFIKLKGVNLEYTKDWFSRYFLPVYIDKKYIVWVVFDEKKVHKVLLLCSANQYDILGKIKSMPLKIDTKIFRK
jgi:hypothetical protein